MRIVLAASTVSNGAEMATADIADNINNLANLVIAILLNTNLS
nr:exported hypothetical protein [Bartonella sp. 1-1C]